VLRADEKTRAAYYESRLFAVFTLQVAVDCIMKLSSASTYLTPLIGLSPRTRLAIQRVDTAMDDFLEPILALLRNSSLFSCVTLPR